MGKMIIKDRLIQLRKGYPTVSDKYNVAGGVVAGSVGIKFGEVVMYSATPGYYEPAATLTDPEDIAGIAVATNIKLVGVWPDDGTVAPEYKPGEGMNLLLDGYLAIEVDSGATKAQIAPGKKVAVILATGKLTTADKANPGANATILVIPGWYFTGVIDNLTSAGAVKAGTLAEIEVKRV